MGKFDKKYEALRLFSQLAGNPKGPPQTGKAPPSGSNSKSQSQAGREPQTGTGTEIRKQIDLSPQVGPESAGSPDIPGSVEKEISLREEGYYEIEYDTTPMPGVGKFVLKTQKIEEPERDEIRELFNRMREIARNNRVFVYGSSKFYNRRVQQERSKILYRQGKFMADFEDDYGETVPYSEYFPCYQMMGYKQLRTYFTWRTKVRRGRVEDTSLSYAYLYFYELLNNIGVADPQEGLDKLLFFWKQFREFQPAVDKHVSRWLKDYHIYYELPQSFQTFAAENDLTDQYPELGSMGDQFSLYCDLSRYDIRKSGFYTEDRQKLIQDCFKFTMNRLTTVLAECGLDLEELIFPPSKFMTLWTPFQEALFYPWVRQRDRHVVLSSREIYVCSHNQWEYQTKIAAESGRQLLGYILKQMESVLRQAVKYKYKIAAGIGMLHPETVRRLKEAGISLEKSIAIAVMEFYREATKTVVTVDRAVLEKIRREALQTQEKLTVPEEEKVLMSAVKPPFSEKAGTTFTEEESAMMSAVQMPTAKKAGSILAQEEETEQPAIQMPLTVQAAQADWAAGGLQQESAFANAAENQQDTDPWRELGAAFTRTEREALLLVLQGNVDIKQFADAHGVMLEVLADGINEKAVDFVGDSLLDEEFTVYSDYLEQVKGMLENG